MRRLSTFSRRARGRADECHRAPRRGPELLQPSPIRCRGQRIKCCPGNLAGLYQGRDRLAKTLAQKDEFDQAAAQFNQVLEENPIAMRPMTDWARWQPCGETGAKAKSN